MPATAALKATSLNAAHRSLSARMVDFGGWDMPVQYSSLVEEHLAVRRSAGVFDVSHMGEIDITGPEELLLTEYVTTNAACNVPSGRRAPWRSGSLGSHLSNPIAPVSGSAVTVGNGNNLHLGD